MRLIAEDLLLLALDDDEGKISWSATALPKALVAALVAELSLRGRVAVTDGDQIAVSDETPTGDDLLDEALRLLMDPRPAQAGMKLRAEGWVIRVRGDMPKLRDQLQERLVAHGILRQESKRVLLAFKAKRLPTADPEPERALRALIRGVLLEGAACNGRDAVLICLAAAGNALGDVLSKDEITLAEERLREVAVMEPVIRAVAPGVAEAALGKQLGAIGGGLAKLMGEVDGWTRTSQR